MKTRIFLAVLLPFLALLLQLALWRWIDPFVWFLFFPTVFISARLGGLWIGLSSTVVSATIVTSVFMSPLVSADLARPLNLASVLLFLIMGYFFSDSQERLRRSQKNAKSALAEVQAVNDEVNRLYQKTVEQDEFKTRFFTNELQRYEQIVATSNVMLGFVDRERRYAVTNPAYAALIGRPPAQLRNRKVAEVIGADNYAHIEPQLERAFSGEAQHFIATPVFPDGRHCIVDVEYHPFRQDGEIQGVVVSLRDITALKASEDALKLSEERFRLALDAGNDGLWDWDLRSQQAYLSPHYYEIIGYPPSEVGPNMAFVKKLIYPEDLSFVLKTMARHRRGKVAVSEFECRIITRSGKFKWVRMRGRAVAFDDNGKPVRMLGTIVDISAGKNAEEALRRQADELAQRNAELERFNRATVGRELDMIGLKLQVNALSEALGREAPYSLNSVNAAIPRKAEPA